MSELCAPAQDSKDAQAELFRLAKSELGLSLETIHNRYKPLKVSTMREWAKGVAAMPAWAIGALGQAGVPDELLSLVLQPFARHVGTDEDGEGDLDTAGLDAGDAAHAIARARHPNSPGGIAIVPQERAAIVPLLRKSVASGRRAAA
jgi:hypothetical protein